MERSESIYQRRATSRREGRSKLKRKSQIFCPIITLDLKISCEGVGSNPTNAPPFFLYLFIFLWMIVL